MDGVNPELSNLTCSMTYVESGDIVFLTSDGISDNFDPVVGKFCVPKRTDRPGRIFFFVYRTHLHRKRFSSDSQHCDWEGWIKNLVV